MTQERYINFGHPANAAEIKAINQQFFAPGVLRADLPLFQAASPDQVLINPHAVIFDNGIVLRETEVQAITVPTQPASTYYTIFYTHEDEDIVGGVAASLQTTQILKESVENGVILGWVVYPGGSVQVDDTMLIPNWTSQVLPGHQYKEVVRLARSGLTVVRAPAANILETVPGAMLAQTIPVSPYQITLTTGLLVSKLLAINLSKLRVYCHDDEADMTRVSGSPSASGEYNVNTTTGVVTFHSTDEGKVVDIFDYTYGSTYLRVNNSSATVPGVLDQIFEFETFDVPLRTIFVEYVILKAGFTVDPVEIFDAAGDSITWLSEKDEPSTPDGTISRLKVRLLDAVTSGTEGQNLILRLRQSLAGSAEGLLLKVRASVYDLPF